MFRKFCKYGLDACLQCFPFSGNMGATRLVTISRKNEIYDLIQDMFQGTKFITYNLGNVGVLWNVIRSIFKNDT